VAIVQISQITNRKGLAENLPQLSGAELGWSIDTRQLYIGNGTLEEGAPVIGNTEILTEFSDILNFTNTYTYKGEAAGYIVQTGPTTDEPVTQSLQSWLDQFATVKDFGAVGDGVTDDTEAINRALYQLYCRETNPQIRRGLFFPAGVYRVTSAIKIPPYATLWGEGSQGSVIAMDDGITDYVAVTADSNQATGANIGNAGATPPQNITISNMGFLHNDVTGSVFLIESANTMEFANVSFTGASPIEQLDTDTNGSIGISFTGTGVLPILQIVFDNCQFYSLVWAMNNDYRTQNVIVRNCYLGSLYQGIVLGTGALVLNGPTGTKIMGNMFDLIYAEGIIFGDVSLNASGHNMFYDVANGFVGSPLASIIEIQGNNNVSISDMFQRSDLFAVTYPRINLNNTVSIATDNGAAIEMGTYTRKSGLVQNLINDDTQTIFTIDSDKISAFSLNYTVTRGTAIRTGTLVVSASTGDSTGDLNYSDDYVQNSDPGLTINVSQVSNTITVSYTTNDIGIPGTMLYSINYLS
jgi:hypothetical protein